MPLPRRLNITSSNSEHPLARAIVAHAQAAGTTSLTVVDFEAFTGAGAKARIENRTWHIGSPALFEQLGVSYKSAEARVAAFQEQGKTVVLIGHEGGARAHRPAGPGVRRRNRDDRATARARATHGDAHRLQCAYGVRVAW